MGDVLIRDVDESVISTHKARAAAQGRSLQAELHDVLTRSAASSRTELVEQFRRIRAMTPDKPDRKLAEDYIREDRDRR